MEQINVLVVEDHSIVRTGIKNTLKDHLPENTIITAVARFNQAVDELSNKPFNLIILDINVPGGDAPGMIQKLKEIRPATRILVFSGYDEQFYAIPYLQAGANGYVSKNVSDEEFVKAVQTVLRGDTYLSEDVQQQALSKMLHNKTNNYQGSPIDFLSSREMEVYQLLIRGHSTAEIGELTSLHASTISTYKRRIFDKTGVDNVVDLINISKKVS